MARAARAGIRRARPDADKITREPARPAIPNPAHEAQTMGTSRLEAFSDGVFAIIITIMVLELKVPHAADIAALASLWPVFLSYALSFVYVGIYWNNHHHLLHLTRSVTGTMMWANLHLLFWLSLLPFATGWMGENHFERWPTVLYGVDLLLCALAWTALQACIVRHEGRDSALARAVRVNLKARLSPLLYLLGIGVAWAGAGALGMAVFVLVAALWFVPDRRIEQMARGGR
jgi:uncharacterized membrane protein